MKDWAPDFIGIGAMKAATYWFYTCLEAHPDICMGSRKEVHFFDTKENYDKGIEWYESHFAHCDPGKKQGEITPGYLCAPNAANLIRAQYPKVKLFACLRNPIERAYSHYRFNVVRKGPMSLYDNFQQALEKDPSLIEMGMYSRQLINYYELFPRENILVVPYEDIAKDPDALLSRLYAFVGVDSTFVPEMSRTKKGVTGDKIMEYRIPYLNPFIFRMRNLVHGTVLDGILGYMGVKSTLRRITLKNRRVVEANESNRTNFPPLDEEIYNRLIPVFEDDVKGLEVLIGRDLSAWMESRGV